MAKEIAIGKRAKISEAQQYMLLSVLGAAVILGVAIALTMHFIKRISFNADVIAAEDESITAYSNAIKSTGICKKPSGSVYTEAELKKCDPDSIEVSEIPGTLRANILEDLAANPALNSVPKEGDSSCTNPATSKQYTYTELNTIYNNAKGASELAAASQLIKSCSALRVIPDALPAFKNEEALLASLNKIFNISGWEPNSLSPSGGGSSSSIPGVHELSLSLSIEADSSTTMKVLDNIEHSIREFDIDQATIGWGGNNSLLLHARARAYYAEESSLVESTKTIKGDSTK